jgi:hypothetical protein
MRTCIIETTVDNEKSLVKHLPKGVRVQTRKEPFEKLTVELRLEGDGLPNWCEVGKAQQFVVRGVAEALEGGRMRITPGCGIPVQQVHPSLIADESPPDLETGKQKK